MKKLANLKPGAYFFYGGVQWVVLENNDKIGATLSIAAEPVFNRAFDEENRNDWRVSSLRRELNGPFFDALIAEGANRAAFLDWESDLTADDGMTDYGTATDKIALLSDGLYRKYRQYIPLVDDWCWTLTPWTCNPSYSCIRPPRLFLRRAALALRVQRPPGRAPALLSGIVHLCICPL